MAEPLKDVPFLYYSDHDAHGIDIFKTLKYGSKKSAWVSDISVCSQLEWVGPTRKQYLDAPKEFRPNWMEAYKEKHISASDAQVAEEADKWQRSAEKSMGQKLVALTSKDRGMLRAFETGGWLQGEPVVEEEIAEMRQRPSKFSMANLADFDIRYLRQYIGQYIDACLMMESILTQYRDNIVRAFSHR